VDLNDDYLHPGLQAVTAAYHRQAARMRELETWLGMLIIRHGFPTDLGFRYELTIEEATNLRALLPRHQIDPRVLITADDDGVFVLDTL